MDRLVVGFIVDSNVAFHLIPVITSLQKNTCLPVHVCILIPATENPDFYYRLLAGLLTFVNCTIRPVQPVFQREFDRVYHPEERHDIRSFTLGQLAFCQHFAEHPKILFMEPDQIVRSNVDEWWREIFRRDIKLAAVEVDTGGRTLATLKRLYPNRPVRLYNAGVVIFDTAYWITQGLYEKCIQECERQQAMRGEWFDYYSEGAMNIACQLHYEPLDPRYNCVHLGWQIKTPKEIQEAVILHWNGPYKPWLPHGLNREYYVW